MSTELEFINQECIAAVGKSDYVKFLKGKRLSMAASIRATCYSCNNLDDKEYCKVDNCPLSPYHPYNPNRRNYIEKGKHGNSSIPADK